jgi:hypothetical protein
LGRMEGELRASHLLEGSAIAQNVTEFPPPQLDHLWGLLLCHRLPWIRRPRNPVRHSHRRPTPSSKRSRDSTARERCRRWARADDDRRDLERSAKLFKAANFQPESDLIAARPRLLETLSNIRPRPKHPGRVAPARDIWLGRRDRQGRVAKQ